MAADSLPSLVSPIHMILSIIYPSDAQLLWSHFFLKLTCRLSDLSDMHPMKCLLTTIAIVGSLFAVPGPSLARTLSDTLTSLSNALNIDVYYEEDLGDAPAAPSPADPSASDYLGRCLKGYSHAVLFDGEDISAVWVYRTGKRSYKRISPQNTGTNHVFTNASPPSPADTTRMHARRPDPSGSLAGVSSLTRGRAGPTNAFGMHRPRLSPRAFSNRLGLSSGHTRPQPALSSGGASPIQYLRRQQETREDRRLADSAMLAHQKALSTKK